MAKRSTKAILGGHSCDILTVAFSPDGKTVATAGYEDDSIRLWEVKSGRHLGVLRGHSPGVYRLAFSPDGKTLASSSYGNSVKLWDVATYGERTTLSIEKGCAGHVAFSPDGKTLACGGPYTVKLWDLIAAKERTTLVKSDARVHEVAFSPDGRWLASGDMGASVKVWDVTAEKEVALENPRRFDEAVDCVIFSPDSRKLAAVCNDTIAFWDVSTGRITATYEWNSHPLPPMMDSIFERLGVSFDSRRGPCIRSVWFRPDGTPVVLGSDDNMAKMWQLSVFRRSK